MDKRGVTAGELALGRSMYGDTINYPSVSITRGAIGPFGYTPNNNINLGRSAWSYDFSLDSISDQSFFVHELSHVRDFQFSGKENTFFSKGAGRDYNYQDKLADGNFDINKWGIEERAQLYQDAFLARYNVPQNTIIGFFGKRTTYQIPSKEILQQLILSDVRWKNTTPPSLNECFLAGTMIDMWPFDVKPNANRRYDQKEVLTRVWKKPIEEIDPNDWVVSADRQGNLVPGKVIRTFQNRAKYILNVHGLMMTPGHVTYCAAVEGENNRFADSYVPVLDILRTDGALKRADGTLIRAATGCEVGAPDDEQFWAFLLYADEDGTERVRDKTQLRYGSRWILPNGHDFSMREYLDGIGVEIIKEGSYKGCARFKNTGAVTLLAWTLSETLPKPEDYVLQRSRLTLEEIYRADDWEDGHLPVSSRVTAPLS